MRCRPCRNDPPIRNIATETNQWVNKSFYLGPNDCQPFIYWSADIEWLRELEQKFLSNVFSLTLLFYHKPGAIRNLLKTPPLFRGLLWCPSHEISPILWRYSAVSSVTIRNGDSGTQNGHLFCARQFAGTWRIAGRMKSIWTKGEPLPLYWTSLVQRLAEPCAEPNLFICQIYMFLILITISAHLKFHVWKGR